MSVQYVEGHNNPNIFWLDNRLEYGTIKRETGTSRKKERRGRGGGSESRDRAVVLLHASNKETTKNITPYLPDVQLLSLPEKKRECFEGI